MSTNLAYTRKVSKLLIRSVYKYYILYESLNTLLQHRTNNDTRKRQRKNPEVFFEMPKISHDESCKLFLVMISMVYSGSYYEFLARNWLNIHPRIKISVSKS
jgi:hypothetical protein